MVSIKVYLILLSMLIAFSSGVEIQITANTNYTSTINKGISIVRFTAPSCLILD